ncbi:MAG: hypothetical protein KatS3mg022_3641 [Armatimonadota bacterium]|nr:MAG: hypothetical protein KatS3mg022_3641 [Armatimonadota bacterium]
MERTFSRILAILVTLLTVAGLSGCADKPGPPPGAPPATINQQQNNQPTPPTYGQTREEQKEGQ